MKPGINRQPLLRRSGKRAASGRMNLGQILGLLCLAGVLFLARYFLPPWMAWFEVRGIVTDALETWKETGSRGKAEDRLAELLEEKKLLRYLGPDDCAFRHTGLIRHLKCSWQVLVVPPGVGETWLSFDVYKLIDADGFLENGSGPFPPHDLNPG